MNNSHAFGDEIGVDTGGVYRGGCPQQEPGVRGSLVGGPNGVRTEPREPHALVPTTRSITDA
jgi:hypothetical protein